MKFSIAALLFYNAITTAFTATIYWSIPSAISFNMDIYTPSQQGIYPVIIFLTGFTGIVPGTFYSNLLTKIADKKIIVIGVSKVQNTTSEYVEEKFAEFMVYITDPVNGAKKLFRDNPLTTNVVPKFLCHSAGCRVLTFYLSKRCGTANAQVKLFIMMDPVDGANPFDTSGQGIFLLIRSTQKNVNIFRFCNKSTSNLIIQHIGVEH